jgi:xanthine dehydrogenase YagR molybdenum-binding subunit
LSLVGQGIDRVDGIAKITGAATYSGDVNLPRQAHAVLVLSSVPKGHITSIDSRAARRLPGVLHVMTFENAPRLPQGGRAAVNPPAGRVLSLLQDNEVHYNREPVGVVVAETLEQATAAATTIHPRYEESPAQLDFARAQQTAHSPGKVNGENADSARGAPVPDEISAQVTEIYRTPMEHHNPLEPHATVAEWTGDHVTLYDSTQYITGAQGTLAKVLGVPKEHVRVICPFVGGGFGCKGSMWSHAVLAAMAARQVGRPVKLVLQRPQMFGLVGGRPLTEQHLSIAARQNGQFLFMRHDVFSHTSLM